jgi:hypothetical protein
LERKLVVVQRDRFANRRMRTQHLERLAWILDNSIRIPGTNYRIGVDGLIGLIPGLGDIIGALLSSYIVAAASQVGVPGVVLVRMALNIALESIIGAIPVVGDIFDFVWKANKRNVELLNQYAKKPGSVTASSRLVVLTVITLLTLLLVLLGIIVYWILSAILQAIQS